MSLPPLPSKHRNLTETLEREILEDKYASGTRFPSEAALVKRFGVSRITVGRAVRELERRGLVERRAGSGTFVRARRGDGPLVFGLLIPNLGETEIFEPVCRGMAESPEAANHALLWGSGSNPGTEPEGTEQHALRLCRRYIERKVSGVFFAPLEFSAAQDAVNLQILAELDGAGIAVVLLDRSPLPYPQRSPYDLVGIDNRRAGFVAAQHLLSLGAWRILFTAYEQSASTVQARVAGYREALFEAQAPVGGDLLVELRRGHERELLDAVRATGADGIVCANDRTAGAAMQALLAAEYRIPRDVRLVGIDDVSYASLLPVPLTTVRQPCREIGEVAMATMVDRIARPHLPVRDILLDSELVVRASCGAAR